MDAGVIPCIRIMARIIVLHMSAQFMHAGAQSIIWVEHTVQACSQAAQASMQACIMAMSIAGMPSIDIMSSDMAFIIIASIAHPFRSGRPISALPAEGPPGAMVGPGVARPEPLGRLDSVSSQGIHKPRRRRRHGIRTLLVALVALALTGVASPAFAHDELLGAEPAPDTVVAALPAEIVLTFSGVLLDEPGATEVVVRDAARTSLTGGDPVLDGTKLTQPLTGSADGAVTVIWRVVSSDGHPVSGEYAFTVGDGAAPAPSPTADATDAPDASAAVSDGMRAVWIVLGVVAVALGGALLAVLVARARGRRED